MMNKKTFAAGFTAFALSAGMLFGTFGAQAVMAAPGTAAVTLKEAKNEALSDAGFKNSDVVFKKALLDFDDDTGIEKYEVDFFADDKEFSYDIDATTAAIIEKDVDIMDAEDYQEMKALQEAAAAKKAAKAAKKAAANAKAQQEAAAPQQITADQALEIALNDAGLTAGQVSFANTHIDYDDDFGMTDYDVEFRVGNKEYSYDINPATGAILNNEVDFDD